MTGSAAEARRRNGDEAPGESKEDGAPGAMEKTNALDVVLRSVWHRSPPPVPDSDTLADALRLARRNQVEGVLCRAYPTALQTELDDVLRQHEAFRVNLAAAAARLRSAGVQPILIKAPPGIDYVYSNFDLVVGDDGWRTAVDALAGWAVRRSAHPLERTKLLLHPESGPAAHLHRSVAWFDIPVVPTARLRARARPAIDGDWLVPSESDELRITLAHALFQNLGIDLSELLAIRGLSAEAAVAAARREAAREGWRRGFDVAWSAADDAMRRLDGGGAIRVPVRLPVMRSILVGAEHARSLYGRGLRRSALREMMLRVPLVVAKQRHLIG